MNWRNKYLTYNQSIGCLKSKKEKKMFKWLKDRFSERTTWDGTTLIVFGLVVLFMTPLAKLCAYGALIYGLWTVITKEN